jgi:hypothetical protein
MLVGESSKMKHSDIRASFHGLLWPPLCLPLEPTAWSSLELHDAVSHNTQLLSTKLPN